MEKEDRRSQYSSVQLLQAAAHLLLMNFLPKNHYKYDQLYLQQTAGLPYAELMQAQAIGSGPVVNLLASRYSTNPPPPLPPGPLWLCSEPDRVKFVAKRVVEPPLWP